MGWKSSGNLRCVLLSTATAFGGAEKHTAQLARTLAERGHDVTIVQLGHEFFTPLAREGLDGISIESVHLPGRISELGWRACKRLLRRWRGLVGIFPKTWFPDGSLIWDIAARSEFSRYITIEHLRAEPMPPRSRSRHLGGLVPGIGLWWYRKALLGRLRWIGPHCIVCVSDAVKRALVDIHHFSERKLITVVNGIDADQYSFDASARLASRNSLNISEQAFVFGFVGRVQPVKNLELAIRAFGAVSNELDAESVRLVIVGEGPSVAGLQSLAKKLGLGSSVIFREFTERPWEMYAAFDVFVLPSRNEGLPLALMEAMSCECAAIATDVGGTREVISDRSLGWLVADGDEQGIVAAMQEALKKGGPAVKQMGRTAREHVSSHFNAKVQFHALADIVEQGCEERTA